LLYNRELKMKRTIYLIAAVVILAGSFLFSRSFVKVEPQRAAPKAKPAVKRAAENITYSVSPLKGTAQYKDSGIVQLNGKAAQLVVFETHVGGFDDVEKIYSDPQSFLVIRVERDVAGWFGRERIVEEYDQSNFTGKISKFKGNKKTEETLIKADGPIYNAIILPFYQRKFAPFNKGWGRTFRIPKKIDVRLSGIEQLAIDGRTYEAYRFSGAPGKFDFWISKEKPYVPLKIKGGGIFKYTMLLKDYSSTNP
jgi:hypothetical protein